MSATALNSTFRQFALMFLGRTHVDEDIPFTDMLDRPALDGSIESLATVDSYLAHAHAHLASLSAKQQNDIALRCGAYLGECIRMTWPDAYHWTDNDELPSTHFNLETVTPARNLGGAAILVRHSLDMIMPVDIVRRVLHEGPANGVLQFAESERQHHS
jgi:hypothetical protein